MITCCFGCPSTLPTTGTTGSELSDASPAASELMSVWCSRHIQALAVTTITSLNYLDSQINGMSNEQSSTVPQSPMSIHVCVRTPFKSWLTVQQFSTNRSKQRVCKWHQHTERHRSMPDKTAAAAVVGIKSTVVTGAKIKPNTLNTVKLL